MQRQKPSDKVAGSHKATDMSYNEQSGGLKVVGPILGVLKRLFAISGTQALVEPCQSGAILAIYNPTATTAWLTVSETAAAPAVPAIGEASSIALRPNDYTVLAMTPATTQIRCSEATAVCYLVVDDSYLR